MKEVYIISTGDIVRGRMAGSQRVMNIARSLAAAKINVFLCSYAQIKSGQIESFELQSNVYSLQSRTSDSTKSFKTLDFIRTVYKFTKARKAEIVIYLYPTTYVLKDFIYLAYLKMFRKYAFFCDINEIRSSNVYTATHPSGLLPVIKFHVKNIYDFLVYKLSEIQIPFYDGIVVISSNLEKYFSKLTRKIIKVPILCDTSNVALNSRIPGFDGKVFKICFAGYINCKKEGFNILLEAMQRVNQLTKIELYLYGILNEVDRQELNRLKEVFGLQDNIFYLGNIDSRELLHEFTKYHLLILPRPLNPQTKYGFSTKLSEYLVSGVPILITDVSDNSMYIKDNYNGYVIPPGSVSAMADKIHEIMTNYNNCASRIALNAFQTAHEKFDYRLFSQTLKDFFFRN